MIKIKFISTLIWLKVFSITSSKIKSRLTFSKIFLFKLSIPIIISFRPALISLSDVFSNNREAFEGADTQGTPLDFKYLIFLCRWEIPYSKKIISKMRIHNSQVSVIKKNIYFNELNDLLLSFLFQKNLNLTVKFYILNTY